MRTPCCARRSRDAYGGTLHHLVELAAFADDLVSRGRVLPGIESTVPHAVWRPLLSGADAAWARALATAMPPAAGCRRPPTAAVAIWADALDGLVDAAVRANLTATPGPRTRGRPRRPRLVGRLDRSRTSLHRISRRGRRPGRGRRSSGSPTRSPAPSAPASGWPNRPPTTCSPRPRIQRRIPVSCGSGSRPPTSRARWSRLTRSGGPAAPCPVWAVISTHRRRPSWPSWARPPGSTRISTTHSAPPAPQELTLDTAGAHRFLPRRCARPRHRRLRRPAAGLVDQAVRAARASRSKRPRPPSPDWSPAAAAGSAPTRSPTSATTSRSGRDADRRRAGRAGRRSSRRWCACAGSGSSSTPGGWPPG